MIISKISISNSCPPNLISQKRTVNPSYNSIAFKGKLPPKIFPNFLTQLFRARKEAVCVKSVDGSLIPAIIFKPTETDWYMKSGKEFLGLVWFSKNTSPILGDALPAYYKNKGRLFINSIESQKKYKGIGTQLIKAVVEESKKLGFDGRICLNTSTINPKLGTPVPFYHKLGFKSVNSQWEEQITKAMEENKPIPAECEATTMFLPKEKISEILAS